MNEMYDATCSKEGCAKKSNHRTGLCPEHRPVRKFQCGKKALDGGICGTWFIPVPGKYHKLCPTHANEFYANLEAKKQLKDHFEKLRPRSS